MILVPVMEPLVNKSFKIFWLVKETSPATSILAAARLAARVVVVRNAKVPDPPSWQLFVKVSGCPENAFNSSKLF